MPADYWLLISLCRWVSLKQIPVALLHLLLGLQENDSDQAQRDHQEGTDESEISDGIWKWINYQILDIDFDYSKLHSDWLGESF